MDDTMLCISDIMYLPSDPTIFVFYIVLLAHYIVSLAHQLSNVLKIKHDINQQDLKTVDLHSAKSE